MIDRPNVVVIVADTFRRDHLGAYGNPRIRTPHLDEFARSSVVFDHHVVSSFPTMPARADILTGTFSYTHMGWEPLPRHLLTLPETLSKAGYLTMGIVDTPFYVRTWDPHEPWDAPDYYTARYREGYAGEQIYPCYGKWEEAGLTKDDVDLGHATYCGEVSMVDFWIGRLLAKLDALGLRENTLILFTSDHGFYFGEHGYFGKAEWVHEPEASVTRGSLVPEWLTESWLLTVERSPLYRELTNVPLMVRGPGLKPGRRAAMTSAPDLAPTIMELAGLGGVPTTMMGESFSEVLAGTRNGHRPFVVSSWPLYLAEGEIVTAIDSKARRIANYMPLTVTTHDRSLILGGPADEPELYDLASDPGEQNNAWRELGDEGEVLCERTLTFLERIGTPEEYLAPRRKALDGWRRVVKS